MVNRLLAIVIAAFPLVAHASVDTAEVDAIVAAVKAKNTDMQVLCKSGPDGVKKAVTDVVRPLYFDGKIKGDPKVVGTEAGQKIMLSCREK
jgi:hypothetical protein